MPAYAGLLFPYCGQKFRIQYVKGNTAVATATSGRSRCTELSLAAVHDLIEVIVLKKKEEEEETERSARERHMGI